MSRCRYRHFSFEPPTDWTDRSTVLWSSPSRYDDGENIPCENFVVEQQARGQSELNPVSYLQSELETLQKTLRHFELVAEASECSYGGCRGAQASYCLLSEGLPIQQWHVVLFSDDSIYHLIGTATASRFAEAKPTFQALLDSFQFER